MKLRNIALPALLLSCPAITFAADSVLCSTSSGQVFARAKCKKGEALLTLAALHGNAGSPGSQGAQGIQGLKGDTGATGLTGPKGDTGATGSQGTTGAQGAKGDTGSTGLQGAKGDTGSTGLQGAKGDTGSTGLQGAKGDTGSTGLQGAKGDKGDTGSQGIQGPKGTSFDPTTCSTVEANHTFLSGGFGSVSPNCPTGQFAANWNFYTDNTSPPNLVGGYLVYANGSTTATGAIIMTDQANGGLAAYTLHGIILCCPLP